jgi:ATP-dependent Clp protease ATP-binding subunit ClpC
VFERFTDKARRVLTMAQEEARLLDHPFIGTEHLLLGLLHQDDAIGCQALTSLGISLGAVRDKVEETIGASGTPPVGSPPFTPRAKKVLELSLREALQMNHHYIGTEHLLLGMIREGEGVAATVLVSLGADLSRVRQEVLALIGTESQASGSEPARREPCCPQCRSALADAAVFRTLSVRRGDDDPGEGVPPLSVQIVYCAKCGCSLQLFKSSE